MGRQRGGLNHKINKRIAKLKWLIYKQTPPPAWSTAQKLQIELDHLVETLRVKKETSHSNSQNNNNKIQNISKSQHLHTPATLPKLKKRCPIDCEGPLYTPHCVATCNPPANKK